MASIDSLIEEWDGENVVIRYDREANAWIVIAIHSTRLGPATGGTRMKYYPGLESALRDALRLSAGMTYKYAVPGFPRGGGKCVIAIPDDLNARGRTDLLRRYGEMVGGLGGLFYTGPDVGTSPEDMDVISEAGNPYIFCRTPASGGAGSSGPFTALGVFTGIRAACEHVFGSPSMEGRRVLVQGVGSVGGTLIEHLLAAGAEVMFGEVDEDVVARYRDDLGLVFVPGEDVYETQCDVFAPCALGGILNADTIARLQCRIVAGGANNQLSSPEDTEILRARGIVYAPDYVVNIGGAMGITGIEAMGWSSGDAERRVVESVRSALSRIFEISTARGITTEAAASLIAEENLSRAAG